MKLAALLGFNTFWTFSAGNPFTGGIYAPDNAEFQHWWSCTLKRTYDIRIKNAIATSRNPNLFPEINIP